MESERKFYMETLNNVVNPQSLAAQVLARYRGIAKEYSRFFGDQIYTITSTNPDLKWKQEFLAGENVLCKEVNALVVKPIDITGVEFLPEDFDKSPKIILNPKSNDANLVFPLVKPELVKATRETVAECISRIGKSGSKPMFFTSEELHDLNTFVQMHNKAVLDFYERQSRKFLNLSETVRGMMDAAERLEVDYLRQCGVNESTDTEVRFKVEVETDKQ